MSEEKPFDRFYTNDFIIEILKIHDDLLNKREAEEKVLKRHKMDYENAHFAKYGDNF